MRPASDLAPAALLFTVGVGGGVVSGVWRARPYLATGFGAMAPLPIAREVGRDALAGLAAALLFVALRPLFGRLVGSASWTRGRGEMVATAGAAAVALSPALAWIGLRANRAWGFRPSELGQPDVLAPNLLLVGVAIGAWAILVPILERWRGRGLPVAAAMAGAGAVVVASTVFLAAIPSADEQIPSRPDVLLLVVDALRADRLGAAGYPRPTTPAIDELAGDGVLFRQAIAPSTFTKTSIASLLTGEHPFRHGVYRGSHRSRGGALTADVLPEDSRTLAEVLAARGYLTAAWVQNSHLVAGSGFEQGFVRYWDQQGHAARINRLVAPWLARALPRYPTFVYLHYIDLHDPYRPPRGYRGMFGSRGIAYEDVDLDRWGAHLRALREGRAELSAAELEDLSDLYDEVLRSVDDRIGELLGELRERGLYEQSLVVLTSDHGDAFGEHGTISHSTAPYDELVRVPLIVKLPGGRFAGSVVADQVRLVDVLPTVLDAVGLTPPEEIAGCSLLPLVVDPVWPRECRTAVIEIAEPAADPASPAEGGGGESGTEALTIALRTERWKYIRGPGGEELYDLEDDAGETRNLIDARPEVATRLAEHADAVAAARRRQAGRVTLDEETVRDLRALGYVE